MPTRKTLALAALAACAGAAQADRIDLFMFEDNGVNPLIIDLWVDVVDQGSSVDFVFHNDSTQGVVAEVYFESTNLIGNGAVTGSTGTVNFDTGANPPSPPGSITNFGGAWAGNLLALDAQSPGPTNGVGVGETLTVSFDLLGSFTDVIHGLTRQDGFRIAEHVISIGQQSIWTTNFVPAPGALALLGLAGLAAPRRRR
jgi:hypothetical protein